MPELADARASAATAVLVPEHLFFRAVGGQSMMNRATKGGAL